LKAATAAAWNLVQAKAHDVAALAEFESKF
jgi:hypothetical protein